MTIENVEPLALYVHIPFCETKCPYCDFNTYTQIESLIPSYVSALQKEISLWGRTLGRPLVETVFFGGGTPSYLSAEHMNSVLATVRAVCEVVPGAEVTLEANPGDLTESKLETYLSFGINRLSIGVQSFNDRLLKILGRRHTAAEAGQAYECALRAGFPNVSIDLMYGLPNQTIEDWGQTLDYASELSPCHISMYGLTLEKGTPMERWVSSAEIAEPDQDLAADMYLMAEDVMCRNGYDHYEISNWARPGFQSRHNLTYWRNLPYLGVGPGAHSYLAAYRFSNLKSPREYVQRLQQYAVPTHQQSCSVSDEVVYEVIDAMPVVETVELIEQRLEMAETVMLGLRLDAGVGILEFTRRFGVSPEECYSEIIDELSGLGLVETVEGSVRLTNNGRLMGNEVFGRFFA